MRFKRFAKAAGEHVLRLVGVVLLGVVYVVMSAIVAAGTIVLVASGNTEAINKIGREAQEQ